VLDEIRRQIDGFLTGPIPEALKGVDYRMPAYGSASPQAHEAWSAIVRTAHICGNPEARYIVSALGTTLEVYVQLNVYRLVVVYHVPSAGTLDAAALRPRLERWEIGAQDAGWKTGWRDKVMEDEARRIEVYCYASLPFDFLTSEHHQLYWINDIVQMTRAFMLEAKRLGVPLSP